ncbi:MAG: efflux RND transporter periplasmic adaptor subunit [Verrucomicrobiota bacterium]
MPKLNCFSGLLTVLLLLAGCASEPEPEEVVRPVKMLTLGKESEGNVRVYPGTVNAMQTGRMSFDNDGRVIELPINEGQKVKKGQLLARLDPADFEAELNSAKAEFAQAKAEYNRNRQLYEQKVISLATFQVKEKEFEVSQSQMQIAQKAYDETFLKAPFDGVVAEKSIKNFEQVRAKQLICTIQDVTQLEVVVDVPESDMARGRPQESVEEINKRMNVKAEFASIPGAEFPLRLKEFQTQADAATQTFRITLVMTPPPDSSILPGMTASVIVPVQDLGMRPGTQFNIPANAVVSDAEGKSFVWLVDADEKIKKVPVEVGKMSGQDIAVTSGLEEGQTIAVSGVNSLRNGMKVRPFEDKSAPEG